MTNTNDTNKEAEFGGSALNDGLEGGTNKENGMQGEQAVKMAAKLYECRDAAKSIFGDGYHERMKEYGQTVKSAANAMGCSEIAVAITLANKSGGGMAAICYLASVVEMTEPSNN